MMLLPTHTVSLPLISGPRLLSSHLLSSDTPLNSSNRLRESPEPKEATEREVVAEEAAEVAVVATEVVAAVTDLREVREAKEELAEVSVEEAEAVDPLLKVVKLKPTKNDSKSQP